MIVQRKIQSQYDMARRTMAISLSVPVDVMRFCDGNQIQMATIMTQNQVNV